METEHSSLLAGTRKPSAGLRNTLTFFGDMAADQGCGRKLLVTSLESPKVWWEPINYSPVISILEQREYAMTYG